MTAEAVPLHQPAAENAQFRTLRNAMALAEIGCRAQLIQKMTSAGMPTIRGIISKVGGVERDLGGRQPRSLASLIEYQSRHVEASVFLRAYVRFLRYYSDVGDDVHPDAFIRAVVMMRSTLPEIELTPDHAHLIAGMYHSDEVFLKGCDNCRSEFMAGKSMGECPLCSAVTTATKNVAVATKKKPLTSSASVRKPAPAKPTLIQETTKASDQLGTLRNTIALAELGARPQQIQKMTAAGMPTIRGILALVGNVEKDRGGRHPRSITTLLEYVPRHIEASLFLKFYINVLAHYGGGRGIVHTDAFVRALMLMRSEVPCPDFTTDHAHLVATLYHSGEVIQKKCTVCSCCFLAGQTHQVIRTHVTLGDCPLCRELESIKTGRAVVRIPDVREQRALFNSFVQS